jgi:MoaA/NifB/PqqE/SkfB family radical SAM enzyme
MQFGPEAPLPPQATTVTFEITTRCNLDCVMCTHGFPEVAGGFIKRDAPDSAVDRMLRELDSIAEIHPTGVGEPLMAPGFWRIVDALSKRQAPMLTINTNGILLTERNVQRLIKAPIGRINVSVDAANPLTYTRIRGAEMRKTTDGVQRLVKAVATLPPRKWNRVSMSMVLMRENIQEASSFVRLARELGVRSVYFQHLTEPMMPRERWTVQRGNFTFNYAEQSLLFHPDFADAQIIKAMDAADELGVLIEGAEVLLNPEARLIHGTRPCRRIPDLFDERVTQ